MPSSLYRFTVWYERTRRDGTLLTGTTLITAQRPNLGLAGANDRLKDRFANTSTKSIEATKISAYLSGSDVVKRQRVDKRARAQK